METDPQLDVRGLAAASGVSRRAIRFYVGRGLLPPPEGRGRGGRYTHEHLQRLARIQELQRAGYSLEAIGQIFAGTEVAPPPAPAPRSARRPSISSSLWTRVTIADGVELHFSMDNQPTVEEILALSQAAQTILASGVNVHGENQDDPPLGEVQTREEAQS
jgi:DNA-binding transcriptional MerR regulator